MGGSVEESRVDSLFWTTRDPKRRVAAMRVRVMKNRLLLENKGGTGVGAVLVWGRKLNELSSDLEFDPLEFMTDTVHFVEAARPIAGTVVTI